MRWNAVKYLFSPHSPQSPHFLQKFTAFTAFVTKIYPKTSTRVWKLAFAPIQRLTPFLRLGVYICLLVISFWEASLCPIFDCGAFRVSLLLICRLGLVNQRFLDLWYLFHSCFCSWRAIWGVAIYHLKILFGPCALTRFSYLIEIDISSCCLVRALPLFQIWLSRNALRERG